LSSLTRRGCLKWQWSGLGRLIRLNALQSVIAYLWKESLLIPVAQFIDFPDNLKQIMNGHTAVIKGGLQMSVIPSWLLKNNLTRNLSDGRPINQINEEEVVSQANIIRQKQLKDVVIVGICVYVSLPPLLISLKIVADSPLDITSQNEYRVRDILQRELGPKTNIVCSRDGMPPLSNPKSPLTHKL
jgi:hypothetical protein